MADAAHEEYKEMPGIKKWTVYLRFLASYGDLCKTPATNANCAKRKRAADAL